MARTFTTIRGRRRIAGPLLWLLLVLIPTGAAAESAEPTDARGLPELIQEVAEVLREKATQANAGAEVTVEVLPLDARLRLQPCTDAKIEPRGKQTHGRIPVSVRCLAPKNWSIFMTGSVTAMLPVIVTRQPISRGDILTTDMIASEPQDLSDLRSLYYTETSSVLGKEAKRNFAAGSVIFANQIKQPLAVSRGQRVQILARRGAVQISSQGEALENGAIGDQIRIRNLQSERIVYAWVEGPGRVTTGGSGKRSQVSQR